MDNAIEREKFDRFIFLMEDQIEALEAIAEKHKTTLTRDLTSLEKLESLFDDMTVNSSKDEKDELSITFGRYLGEITIEEFGGKWHLPLENPENINFNTPVIVGHASLDGLEFPALSIMHAYSLRRKTGMLRKALMSQIEPKPADIDHLIEE